MQLIELSSKFMDEVGDYPKVPFPWGRVSITIERNMDKEADMLKDMFKDKVSTAMLADGVKFVQTSSFSLEVEGNTVRQKINGKTVVKYTRDGSVMWLTEGVPTTIVMPMVRLINKVAWAFFKPKSPAQPRTPSNAAKPTSGGKPRQTGKVDRLMYKTIGDKSYMYHSSEGRKAYERHTAAWEVRPYVRRYKSGLTITVKGHTRGNGAPETKSYKL